MTRRTLHKPVTVEGIGIHTGTPSRVMLMPAPSGAGIVFRSQGVEILAHVDNVVDTSRCTVLGKGGVTVSTVEHLMSAFAGNWVTDAYVDIIGTELPIGDGSSNLWADALYEVEFADFGGKPITAPPVREPLLVTGKNGAFIWGQEAPGYYFKATIAVAFDHPLVGTQVANYLQAEPKKPSDYYIEDVAPARTFGFIEEVEALRKAGLALGGSEENAVVVYPDRYSSPLRFPNELARHKLLDLMGDLALAGLPLPNMEIFAVKPSHRLNVEFARALVAHIGR